MYLSVYLSLSISIYLYLCLSISICVYLSLSVSIYLSIYLYLYRLYLFNSCVEAAGDALGAAPLTSPPSAHAHASIVAQQTVVTLLL